MSEPMSPRERALREDLPPERVQHDPVVELAEKAEKEAQERRDRFADNVQAETTYDTLPAQEAEDAPEILTLNELESALERLERLASGADELSLVQLSVEADDALQGIAIVLGMNFGGDVQMMVLAALQRYREIKHYR
jgi:hypothetical protein